MMNPRLRLSIGRAVVSHVQRSTFARTLICSSPLPASPIVTTRSSIHSGKGTFSAFRHSSPQFSKQQRHFAVSGGEPSIIPVPAMGDSISEGTVVAWHKAVGDQVEMDEVLCEVETDKVTVEIRAPDSGVIQELYAKTGDTVLVGKDLVKYLKGATGGNVSAGKGAPPPPKEQKAPAAGAAPPSPKPAAPAAAPSSAPSAPKPAAAAAAPAAAAKGERVDRRVPMTRMRRRIAERLKESQNTAAMLTTYNEIDMTSAIEMRNLYKEDFEKKHGVKLGFMSIFAYAAMKSLQEIPIVNAVIDGDDVVRPCPRAARMPFPCGPDICDNFR
jgi:2-oxoglutarate dehydrogenase E2 component (dihydrolipoamide succinyltransferase)